MVGSEISFGRFRLDLARPELRRDQTPVRLGSRARDILCVLAAAEGALVSKDELMARVWGGVVVEENTLQVHISALRKALEEDEGEESWIVTVPGRGYRLLRAPEPPAADRAAPEPSVPAADEPSLAVLPFASLSGDPEQEHFADGVVEEILTALARIRGLSVTARNSSFAYKGRNVEVKQVGRELGVRYVLEGSVRKSGDRARITAQLIDAGSGAHVWADRFDGPLADVFALQDQVAASVAGAVEPVVASETPARGEAPPEAAPSRRGEAERRQITALSCELVGPTMRADGGGLEEWRETVGGFRRCVAAAAERHHGFVYGDLGNSALILFGYPAAHDHDAEQAIRAGLELCAAVRTLGDVPVRCKVGIATGLVIVGDPAGVGAARGESIVGDAPNLAARLAAAAPPDTVAVGPATRRLIGNLFDCRELGAIETAGGSEPIRRWQVLGENIVASRFEALRGSALSPLIGRDEEIDLLLRRWARAKAGDGQVVLVSGEPGIGSRASQRHWRRGSVPIRICACAISARPITRTARSSHLSSSSHTRRGSPVTIRPRPDWRSSRPGSPAPRRRMWMWRCSPI